jgi:glutathione S-transferase
MQFDATNVPQAGRVLWGIGTPRTLRAHWALHELELDYQVSAIKPRKSGAAAAELLQKTGRRKTPVLQDGTFTIGQSAAIVSYLSDVYGNEKNSLFPHDSLARARVTEWCYFIMTELDATSLYVIRRHHALRHIYGAAPNVVEAARQYFIDQLEAVDQHLSAGSRYLMGEQFAAVDILLTSCLLWAHHAQLNLSASCSSYLERTTARKAFRRAYVANAWHASDSYDFR